MPFAPLSQSPRRHVAQVRQSMFRTGQLIFVSRQQPQAKLAHVLPGQAVVQPAVRNFDLEASTKVMLMLGCLRTYLNHQWAYSIVSRCQRSLIAEKELQVMVYHATYLVC